MSRRWTSPSVEVAISSARYSPIVSPPIEPGSQPAWRAGSSLSSARENSAASSDALAGGGSFLPQLAPPTAIADASPAAAATVQRVGFMSRLYRIGPQ